MHTFGEFREKAVGIFRTLIMSPKGYHQPQPYYNFLFPFVTKWREWNCHFFLLLLFFLQNVICHFCTGRKVERVCKNLKAWSADGIFAEQWLFVWTDSGSMSKENLSLLVLSINTLLDNPKTSIAVMIGVNEATGSPIVMNFRSRR